MRILACLVRCFVAVSLARSAAAQPSQSHLTAAQAALEAGRYDEARASIAEFRRACSDRAEVSCSARVALEMGIISHTQARQSEPEVAKSLVLDAARYYRDAITASPSYTAAQENLLTLLRELPPAELDSAALITDSRRDPGRRGGYLFLQGERLRAQGQTPAAADLYRISINAPGSGAAPVHALVELFLQDSTALSAAQVLATFRARESEDPSSAAVGYLAVVQKAYQRAPAAAGEALVRWVTIAGRAGGLDSTALAQLPNGWEPAEELRAYTRGACRIDNEWWSGRTERESALAQLALVRGREMLSEGDAEGAISCWGGAFPSANGGVALELAREIVLAARELADSEDAEAELRWVEDRLLGRKGVAIVENDSLARLQFHIALGLLYSERGQWANPHEPTRSAIVQLERAINLGRTLDQRQHQHRPIPLLHSRLAAGYAATGRIARADEQLLAASRAFLDLDALDSARTVLNRLSQEAVAARDTLIPLIDLRTRIAQAQDAALDSVTVGPCSRAALEIPLNGAFAVAETSRSRAWMGTPFLARQRFKILTDCAFTLPAGRQQLLFAAEALAPIIADPVGRPLGGSVDYTRFENAAGIINEATGDSSWAGEVSSERVVSRDSVSVAMGGDVDPLYVRLSREGVLKLRALTVLTGLGVQAPFRVRGNVVTVYGDIPASVVQQAQAQLRTLHARAEIRTEPIT